MHHRECPEGDACQKEERDKDRHPAVDAVEGQGEGRLHAEPDEQVDDRERQERVQAQEVCERQHSQAPEKRAVRIVHRDVVHLCDQEDACAEDERTEQDEACAHAREGLPFVSKVKAGAVGSEERREDDRELPCCRYPGPVRRDEEQYPDPHEDGTEHRDRCDELARPCPVLGRCNALISAQDPVLLPGIDDALFEPLSGFCFKRLNERPVGFVRHGRYLQLSTVPSSGTIV